jgi:xylose isomerase
MYTYYLFRLKRRSTGRRMDMKRKISMPYWCVANPVGDPFGGHVLDRIDSVVVTDILCDAKKKELIDYTSAHDDDLVEWDPENEMDDTQDGSTARKTLGTIRGKLEKYGLGFKMITCDLHGNPVFRNGGLTNPDPRIRLLAAKKVMRALRIGHFLGAEFFTYWVARDGFETQFAIPWGRNYTYIVEGLNLAARYAENEKLSIRRGTIENKPNEPRGEMFLPTVGHSLALISRLERPDFWGVNPELLQHEQMTGLTGVAAAAMAAYFGKLFFLHIGNQKPNQFDNDNPVLVGMDGVKEFVSILYVLEKMNWQGYVEFDNHVLRTDTAPGKKNAIDLRKEFIELNVGAYKTAEQKANLLVEDPEINRLQSRLWDSFPAIEEVLKTGDPEKITNTKVDYSEINEEAVRIGKLDMVVNRKLLGLDR